MVKRKNPYTGVKFKTPTVATEYRFKGSGERAVGGNGDLNASSKKDLLSQMAKLMDAASKGEVQTESQASRQERSVAHREMVQAAFNSQQASVELGEVMAEELYQAANREGFMRRFLSRQELVQGGFPRFFLRLKNMVATVASAPSKVESQLVRDKQFFPPEFYIMSRIFIEERDIQQSPGDLLEEKYVEGLEGLMVAEDRTYRKMLLNTLRVANDPTQIIGTLNPTILSTLRNQVARWDIPANNMLMANDLWSDIAGDSSFAQAIDPVSKHEIIMTGQIGVLLGLNLYSDAYRHPEHRVLNKGEIFIIGDPINHGQYTDRGGVNSQPIDGAIEKRPGRGWWMSELVSMAVGNPRSVAYAVRG